MKKLFFLLVLARCATLNTMGMSESCKRLYDACLNTCPGATAAAQVSTGFKANQGWQVDVASCTDDCNGRARDCK